MVDICLVPKLWNETVRLVRLAIEEYFDCALICIFECAKFRGRGQGRQIQILLEGFAPGFTNYLGAKMPSNFQLLGGAKI